MYDEYTIKTTLRYTLAMDKLSLATTALYFFIIALAIIEMPAAHLQGLMISAIGNVYIADAVLTISIVTAMNICFFPLLFITIGIDRKYGIAKEPFKNMAQAIATGIFVSLVIFLPFLILFFILCGIAGNYWWMVATALTITMKGLVLFVYPVFIAPLSKKYIAIDMAEQYPALAAFAQKNGFNATRIKVEKTKDRTSRVGAYLLGIGRWRIIVISQSAFSIFTEQQIMAMIAHELGHANKHHVLANYMYSSILTGIGYLFMSLLMTQAGFFEAFGFSTYDLGSLIAIMLLYFMPLTYFMKPLSNALSWRHELSADKYAAELLQSPSTVSSVLVSMHQHNITSIASHPIYAVFSSTNPRYETRLRKLGEYLE
jgi:Zn-dependent protease with chaperone function